MTRFLADENFPGIAVQALRQAGYDVAWVRADSPGCSDKQVLTRASEEERVLLTFDKDFGDLVYRLGFRASHGILLFRVSPSSPEAMRDFIIMAAKARSDWKGYFSVIEPGRVRMRKLPHNNP